MLGARLPDRRCLPKPWDPAHIGSDRLGGGPIREPSALRPCRNQRQFTCIAEVTGTLRVMLARGAISILVTAAMASWALSGCSSGVASQARELCVATAESRGGGVGEPIVRSVRGWDRAPGPVVVKGDWLVRTGQSGRDATGTAVEWRAGYVYPWECTVDSGELSKFEFAWGPQEVTSPEPSKPTLQPAIPVMDTDRCIIKGNISFTTRERIYHVPGQAYYEETVINEAYGERWFCTEQEARDAGWRKART